jgi:ankyrin repeat protein
VTAQVRSLLIILALLAVHAAHARSLSDIEAATLNGCKTGRVQREAATALAARLGRALDTDAATAVVRSGCGPAIQAFATAFRDMRSHQPGLVQSDVDSMVLRVADEPAFFEVDESFEARVTFLVQVLGSQGSSPYQSPQLYQRLYDSVKRKFLESPTSLGPTFNGHWAAPDGLLINNAVPGIEPRVAALLPLMYSACQAKYLARLFQERHYVPALDPLRALYLRTPLSADACDWQIIPYMASLDQAATTEALLMRLHWLFDQPAGKDRDRQIMAAAEAFSDGPVASLVSHASLEADVREHLQNPELLHPGERFFDRMEDIAARSNEFTPANLSYWINAGSVSMVRRSIEHGVDVNADPPMGLRAPLVRKTALAQAIGMGNLELVKLLVDAGADVNGRWPRSANGTGVAQYDRPPLSYAVCALPQADSGAPDQSTAIVSLLLAHGAQVAELSTGGITALHLAAQCGNTATLDTLVAAGADINGRTAGTSTDSAYPTPLHFAAKSHRPANVIYLLDHHAQINARSVDGATPLWWAVEAADPTVVKLLLDRGANVHLAAHKDIVGDITPIVLAHELPGRSGEGRDPKEQQIEDLLRSRGAFLNPITLAKHKLIAAMFAAAAASGGMN